MLFIRLPFATENAFSKLKNHRCNLWALVSYFLAIDLQGEMLCSSSLKLFSSYFLQNVKQMFLIWEKIASWKLERALKKHFPLQIYSFEIAYKSFEIAYVIFDIITFIKFWSSGKLFLSYRFARGNAFWKLLEAF